MSRRAASPNTVARQVAQAEAIMSYRRKWLQRVTSGESPLDDAFKIKRTMPSCPCDVQRTTNAPCMECVIYFLEKRGDFTIKESEMKLSAIDTAHTQQLFDLRKKHSDQLSTLRQQYAEKDNDVLATLRQQLNEKEVLVLDLQNKLSLKEAELNNLQTMYDQRLTEGISDEGRIAGMKDELEGQKADSKVVHECAMKLVNYVHQISGGFLPEEIKQPIAKLSKTKLSRAYHLDRMIFTTVGCQTEESQASSSVGNQQMVSLIQNGIQNAFGDGALLKNLARNLVDNNFLDHLKKFLLSKEEETGEGCYFRRFFERVIPCYTRDYYTTQEYYQELKMNFFPKTKEGQFEAYQDCELKFIPFKCNQTATFFGTLVISTPYMATNSFKKNATWKTPVAIKALNIKNRNEKRKQKLEATIAAQNLVCQPSTSKKRKVESPDDVKEEEASNEDDGNCSGEEEEEAASGDDFNDAASIHSSVLSDGTVEED